MPTNACTSNQDGDMSESPQRDTLRRTTAWGGSPEAAAPPHLPAACRNNAAHIGTSHQFQPRPVQKAGHAHLPPAAMEPTLAPCSTAS